MSCNQLEHQTGLILSHSNESWHFENAAATCLHTQQLSPQILEALRILRDANPSLKSKLNHANHVTDEYITYWNKYQNVVVIEDGNITGLNLGGLMVRLVDCVPFMRSLNANNLPLNMLNFGGTDIPMQNLLEGFREVSITILSSLNALYLGGCGIASRKGVDSLNEILELCPSITTLDLRYNDFTCHDIVKLEPSLSSSKSKIEILHLEGNAIKCDGAKAIGEIIYNTEYLKELYLGSNKIASNGAKALAEGLQRNSSIEKLYLESNSIGNVGADAFRVVILGHTENRSKVLQKLYVDNNGIGKDAATSLGRALNSDGLIDGSLF